METTKWFERKFDFGLPMGMLPFYLERLEGTVYRIENKGKGVDDKILSTRLSDKWSVKQNIGHLAEVDEIVTIRINEILSGVSPISSAVFETKQDYNAQPVQQVIEYFNQNRLKNLIRYKELSDVELNKQSLHPRLKVLMSPVDLAWFDAEHDDHHLVTINTILKSF
jgi:hypothetical protein